MISRVTIRFLPALWRPGKRFAPIAAAFIVALLAGVQAQAAGLLAYVTMQNGVAVIDRNTDTLIDAVEVCSPGTPAPVAIAALGNRLYVPCLNEGVVKVVDRIPRALVATIRLPPDSLHSKSSAVVMLNGTQVYVTTKQGLAVVDTTTNVIVNTIPLGPVSALETGPAETYVRLQDGQIMPLAQALPQVRNPDYVPQGLDQPISSDHSHSCWLAGDTIYNAEFGVADPEPAYPDDDPYVTAVYIGGELPSF